MRREMSPNDERVYQEHLEDVKFTVATVVFGILFGVALLLWFIA